MKFSSSRINCFYFLIDKARIDKYIITIILLCIKAFKCKSRGGGENMQQMSRSQVVSPIEAIIMILLLLSGIGFGIIKLQLVPHVPVILAILFLLSYGIVKKIKVKDLETALVEGAKSGVGAVLIFLFIGVLISSWMVGGTIPTFIYLALELISGKWFYAIVFVLTACIGLGIGSSLTTAATVGVAFISIADVFGLSSAITAGAIVSGAFLGDKMSPLSDTTTLAAATVKVDLFEHIKNMTWTTVPAFILSFLLFLMLSPSDIAGNFGQVIMIQEELRYLNLVHWYSLIPFFVLAVLAFKKVPSVITLGSSSLTALGISLLITDKESWAEIPSILYSGFKVDTEMEVVHSLLSRGGVESMFFSISLVLLALSMGGILSRIGILSVFFSLFIKGTAKVSVLITSTVATALGINILVGEQYLSIIMTGNLFEPYYQKAGLHPKNLSRALEDAGTVINPLVPWGVCGVFLTGVLGVQTIEYAMFAFFCILSPILTIVAGWTKISIKMIEQKAAA